MQQSLFTSVIPIKLSAQARLETILEDLYNDRNAASALGYQQVAELQFASIFKIDDGRGNESLVFEFNGTGTPQTLIDAFCAHASDKEISPLLECCDWNGAIQLPKAGELLKKHIVLPLASYIGNVGRTQPQVAAEEKLFNDIQKFLNSQSGGSPPDRAALVRQLIDFANQKYPEMMKVAATMKKQPWGLAELAAIGGGGFLFVVLALALLIPERMADRCELTTDPRIIRELERGEDFLPTNHMVHLSTVRTGLWRVALHNNMRLLKAIVRIFFQNGTLGSIPSIHFAHWSSVFGGDKLLFVSNFDGSFENYLDDFIMKAATGLTLAWCATFGFPRSLFLVLKGASDSVNFLRFGRHFMKKTHVWYKAYPELSVQNVDRNTRIRRGLQAKPGDAKWLAEL